jgi:hypothetical protein
VILKAGREKKLIAKGRVLHADLLHAVVANNTLFVATLTHLFAIGK